ncbi:MAG TPA: O-antigen ligase family protein, partial [Lacunisphaera sp.]
MSSARHDPFRLLVRIFAWGGLAGLAALTLVDRGATRMYATPWMWLLVGVAAIPPGIFLLRLFAPARMLRLPSPGWSALAVAVIAVPLVSALLSPYRGPSLLAVGVPLAAACLFFLLSDWLAEDASHRLCLEQIFAAAAAANAIVSAILWLVDLASLSHTELFSSAVFLRRNAHPLGHSNYTAGLMLLGLPWLARLTWSLRGSLRSAAIFATGLTLLNLFISGSRGGLIGLAALGVAGVAVARLGWKRFLLVAGGAVALAALLAVANPRVRSLVGPTDPLQEPNLSTVQRTAMLDAGLMMGRDRPLLGWGPNTTPLAYPRYRHALDGGAENVLQLHSTPLQLWAETGAAGVLTALLLAGLVALNWHRSPVAVTTLAGYGAFALTDHQLDVPAFAAAIAVLAACLAGPSARPASVVSRLNLGLIILVVAGAIALLGARDRTPALNAEALQLARDPAQRDRAVALLSQSLALNPDQEIAHFNLGWLLLVPEPAKAEAHFRAAAHLVPDKGGVYFGLGLARLNQGNRAGAARALALECVNEPLFLASPWWNVPEVAALREPATKEYEHVLAPWIPTPKTSNPWVEKQAALLRSLAPRLGQVSPGPEINYRRERIGYPVLMRNQDIGIPVDLYDVREDPRFPASVPFPLPSKGWLPSPRLLKLLDDPVP